MKYNSTVILGAKYIRERNVLTYFNIRQNKEFIARKSYCFFLLIQIECQDCCIRYVLDLGLQMIPVTHTQ